MVEAPWQPLLRMTKAALPVKAANRTLSSKASAMCLASVVLPVPAYPNRRNSGDVLPLPGLALSQSDTLLSAASCSGEKAGIGSSLERTKNESQCKLRGRPLRLDGEIIR